MERIKELERLLDTYMDSGKLHRNLAINAEKYADKLKEELEQQKIMNPISVNMIATISDLSKELKEAREVIKFYSETENWDTKNGKCDTYIDGVISYCDVYAPWGDQGISVGGKRARELLSKYKRD